MKTKHINRSIANAFKASVLAATMAAAPLANALVLDCGDDQRIWQFHLIGNKIYQLNHYEALYTYDLNKADASTTVLPPESSATIETTEENYTNRFATNGSQFIFYSTRAIKPQNIYLHTDVNTGERIEIKTKDGSAIAPSNVEMTDKYTAINDYRNGIVYVFDISKSNAESITASQVILKNDEASKTFGRYSSISGSNLLVNDETKNAAFLYNLNAGDEAAINSSYIKITPQDDLFIAFGKYTAINSKYAVISATTEIYGNETQGALYVFDITSESSDAINSSQIRLINGFSHSLTSNNESLYVNNNGYVASSTTTGAVIWNLNAGSEAEINGSQVRIITGRYAIQMSLDGDTFSCVPFDMQNKIIAGDIKSVTTLDNGTSKSISGFGFETLGDWIIGKYNSNNSIVFDELAAQGYTAHAYIMNEGKAVYIGQNTGSNNNTLRVLGKIHANDIYIGAEGNSGNTLIFGENAVNGNPKFEVKNIYLAEESMLVFECEWQQDDSKLFDYLNNANLWAWDSTTGEYVLVDEDNYLDLLTISNYKDTDYMLVQTAIPEPAIAAAIIGALSLAFAAYRRRI